MIYILDSTARAGQNNIESYSDDSFANISKSNTLRFATVASPAANKLIFKDKMNMYGKTLWDYSLLIGHSAYDVNNPENTVYNNNRDGLRIRWTKQGHCSPVAIAEEKSQLFVVENSVLGS
ncbi:MAG: hypothetical protein LKF47_03775 [Megasphaera sp.]|jgi:hypothetical protein|nr:hypothetical protein [Megasphaera sp.]MCI1247899.1 hypothetical protein [Megasphaera sp.]